MDEIPFRARPWSVLIAVGAVGVIVLEIVGIAFGIRKVRVVGSVPHDRTITVSGEGKVRVPPDIAVVTAGITAQAPSPGPAQREVNRKMGALVAAVVASGVPRADIQTTQFSLNPQYAYEEKRGPRITGYEARQSVTIRIRDLERIETVLAAVAGAGATDIGGLQLTIDDPDALQSEARGAAIADAKANAEVIARQLGVRLGAPIAFSESGGGGPPPIFARAFKEGIGGDIEPTIEPGTEEIVVNVTVTYPIK